MKQDLQAEGGKIKADLKALKNSFVSATATNNTTTNNTAGQRKTWRKSANADSLKDNQIVHPRNTVSSPTTEGAPASGVSFRLRRVPSAQQLSKQQEDEGPEYLAMAKQKAEAHARMREGREKELEQQEREKERQERERERQERERERQEREAEERKRKEIERQERERERQDREAERRARERERQERDAEEKRRRETERQAQAKRVLHRAPSHRCSMPSSRRELRNRPCVLYSRLR